MTDADAGTDEAAVAAFVKSHDIDRYWACLFAPRQAQAPLLAVNAFFLDIARIPERVSDPMLAEVRLKWWYDAIANATPETRTGNPNADAFLSGLWTYGFDRDGCLRMVEARARQAFAEPLLHQTEAEAFFDAIHSPCYRQSCGILGAYGEGVKRAARYAAVATGCVDGLTGRHPKVVAMLPPALSPDSETGRKALIELARHSLDACKRDLRTLPGTARSAFRLLAVVAATLRQVEKHKGQPNLPDIRLSPLRRFVTLWRGV